MKRGFGSRPPLVRMARIHALLCQGTRVTCNAIARQLEMSTRTIYRDIEFMRDQLGLPIAYDASGHTFTYAGPVNGAVFAGFQGKGAA